MMGSSRNERHSNPGKPSMPNATKTIDPAVIAMLETATTDGPNLTLPQMDRGTYVTVIKVLTKAGGKWNRKAGAIVFPADAAPIVSGLIGSGEVTDNKQALQAYYSPPAVAEVIVEAAGLEAGMMVLEPSAGDGAIIKAIDADVALRLTIVGYELQEEPELPLHQVTYGTDFTRTALSPMFDRVLMNPPFTRQQDIAHVTHALKCLAPGGRLVAVMSPSWQTRDTKAAAAFRALLDVQRGWTVSDLPDGSFAESGTNVSTVLLVVDVA
jgi:hypothetical protein